MVARNDLSGKRFGRLTVLEYSHSKRYAKSTVVYWKCICDCGNECIVSSQKLVSGNTKSCGCFRKESATKHESLVGRRFGRLSVLEEAERNEKGDIRWLCKCDCGKNVIVRGSSLKNGDTTSCGCFAKERKIESHKRQNRHYTVGNITYVLCNDSCKYFIIDTEDWDKIKNYSWYLSKEGYPRSKIGEETINLNRLIMNTPNGLVAHHLNRKPWDNRKENLENTTLQVNNREVSVSKSKKSTDVLGVYTHKTTGKYRATVTVDYKQIHLGLFDNIQDAIEARKKGELEYYGRIID